MTTNVFDLTPSDRASTEALRWAEVNRYRARRGLDPIITSDLPHHAAMGIIATGDDALEES